MTTTMISGEDCLPTFIFAHGAGAGMEHNFMETIAQGLADKGIRVIRFDFPYMVEQKAQNKKRPPNRAPILLEAFQHVIESYRGQAPIVIGGKSMGGRMASLLAQELADDSEIVGVACLGFPFHPPGKPERFKGEHLAQMNKPCLILQGERDTFGKREEVEMMTFSDRVQVEFIPDGDHSFKPRKSSGFSEQGNLELAVEALATFIHGVCHAK